MAGHPSSPGEAGIFKRGADLSLIYQFLSSALQEARHPSKASQFSRCCPGQLSCVILVSQLAVKSDSQDLKALAEASMFLFDNLIIEIYF